MRDPNVRLTGGNSQLYAYYDGLASSLGASPLNCQSQIPPEQKRQLLEQWLHEQPSSVAAAIALGSFWADVGWSARGDKYDDQVSDQQWGELSQALEKARTVLRNVDGFADPHMYFVLIDIARGEANPRAKLDRLYSAATQRYPNYYHYYSQRATLLQERWYGRPGELNRFCASLLQSPGGDAGLVAYSYVSYLLMQLNSRPTLLQATGLSWPTIKTAYATRERLYGLRNRDWNALLNLALAAVDRDSASAALGKIGNNWDPAVWKERRYFDEAVAWTKAR